MAQNNKRSLQERARIPYKSLKNTVDPTKFEFETTEEIPRLEGIVGQERGRRAMEFGLNVKKNGYNIYVAGMAGTGKTSYTNSIVKKNAKGEGKLYDWCYVYNFENKYSSKLLQLPVGVGKVFQKDMKDFVEDLKIDIPKAFNEESYQKERAFILREFQERSGKVIERLNDIAKDHGFIIKQSGGGFISVPIVDDKPMEDEEYEELDSTQLVEMEKKSTLLQEKAVEISHKIYNLEKEAKGALEDLDNKTALMVVGYRIEELKEKYKKCKDITKYLESVQEDILGNIDDFKGVEEEEGSSPLEVLTIGAEEDVIKKYAVNLLVDNSQTTGAPKVTAENPTFYNLMGKVEYENKMGVLTTDFTKIKPGYLHQANGGYIIIQAMDILSNNYAWEALKRALKTSKIIIENIGEQLGLIANSSIKPDAMPLDIKVILIGNPDIYQLLYYYDEDFRKLFKIKADFDVEMNRDIENMSKLASFIRTHCEDDGLKPFDKTAVAKMVEYSGRLAENQYKLSTRFNPLVEILYEADTWAELMEEEVITEEHIQKAIHERKYRSNLYQERLQQAIKQGDILIDTQGEKIGQVNGLAIYQLGKYRFGRPSRITATTFVGQKGIVNIERESNMGGDIHNKGVYILSGYLGAQFAQKSPLALSAHLTFEQSYGGIDGDSASSTELYALLSSLSGLPIQQGLAVTGSVNQRGEIQPIGGVNEKIEGFFDVCQIEGLTGEQGVLIPHQNIKNLMLKDQVIEAVREGLFHIYGVKTIEEGIELLTGIPAGVLDEQGEYQEGTAYCEVVKKLRGFLESVKNYGKEK